MPPVKLSWLLLTAGLPLIILGIAGLSHQFGVHSAYSRAGGRHELIFVNAHRRMLGLKPRRSWAQATLPALALALGLFLSSAGLLSLSGVTSDPVWTLDKPAPSPDASRPPLSLRVGCYNQYLYFKSRVDGESLTKVNCVSPSARSEVVNASSDSACEKNGDWVYSSLETDKSYCVRPVFRKGVCVPTWKDRSGATSYFSYSRSCKDALPTIHRPTNVSKVAKYGYFTIKSIHKYKTGGWVCDEASYRYNVKSIRKTICTTKRLK